MSRIAAWSRFTATPFAATFGLLGINSGLTLLISPERAPAHALVAPVDTLWAVTYSLGGLLILAGIGTARANVEAAGCLAFAGGALVSALAYAVVLHWAAWNTVAILVMFAAAGIIRGRHLAQGRILVLTEPAVRRAR